MTEEEKQLMQFSTQFDIYWNNIASNKAPGLNEYEKSVVLTKAQEDLVLSLYNGRNPLTESFEQTEELRRHLANIIKDATIEPAEDNLPKGISPNSKFFVLPDNLWFITYESVSTGESQNPCENKISLGVVPATQDTYQRLKKNPFRGANSRRALRFDRENNMVEIVSDKDIVEYYVRYVRKLNPIILVDLDEDLYIDKKNTKTPCELDSSLHNDIIIRAVDIAKSIWISGTGQQ